VFRNRAEAGRKLAAALRDCELTNPLVLAIPRGGVVTGAALAGEIGAELDVVLTHKLRAWGEPELAIGAISEDGDVYLNAGGPEETGISDDYFHRERGYQLAAIAARKQRFRSVRPKASIQGRSVIVSDDGIATGSTMIAALQTIRSQQPCELIVAVPVAPDDRIHDLQQRCDKFVCLLPAPHFWAVGQFYEDFPTVDDEQVVEILKEFARHGPNPAKAS
jgi:predicted phosphoribosyltransferase